MKTSRLLATTVFAAWVTVLRRAAHAFSASTIPVVGATAAVTMVGTLAILGLTSDALDEERSAFQRQAAAFAHRELPPVVISIAPFLEVPAEPRFIAPIKKKAPGESKSGTEPAPKTTESPKLPGSSCEVPVVGELPSVPVVGCPLDAVPDAGGLETPGGLI